ncbi:hypothetical protein [Actinomadura rudentiformis]|uniref:Uncharacterized protein n=1 Tax=Actinomadura rudentiformis TaxID=359158 RepID=A0A6H9Y7J5_9ACTN|nr:hypothetical protein [Actinomadura rudentiformis]KAB2340620.1 hypothetical protein F8566_44690 [Actinomadura rudentiformis]
MTMFHPDDADDADGAASLVPRTGRWQLPSERSAAAHARRTIHAALQRWGLGPAADTLTSQLASLIQDLSTRSAVRVPALIDLRLELRAADRLLLGEVQASTPDRPGPADQTSAGKGGRGIIALTYGRRLARNGTATWYTHAFTWWQPNTITTDR